MQSSASTQMRQPRAASLLALVGLATLAGWVASPAKAAPAPTCDAFKAALSKSTNDLQVDFVRPLVVSRLFGSDDEIFDLVTKYQLDGSIRCRRGRLVRFEARISMPASDVLLQKFGRIQRVVIAAALGWPAGKVETAVSTLNAEAGEYLQASIERGDIYQAGKTEYHEGGSDMGMIFTPSDRAFILAGE